MAVDPRLLAEYQDCKIKGETEKARRIAGKILEDNGGLINRIVKKYKPFLRAARTTDWEDLFQAGQIGMIKALEAYNPAAGAFSTYATFKILHEVQCAVRLDRLVHWPKNNGKPPPEYTLDAYEEGDNQEETPESEQDFFFRSALEQEDLLPVLCMLDNSDQRDSVIYVCAGKTVRETAKELGIKEIIVQEALRNFHEQLEKYEKEQNAPTIC